MGWTYLMVAAAFEVGFTTAMKLSANGKWWAEILFIVCVVSSFLFLQAAVKTIPLGVAYAVWTGIGAVGTLAISIAVFGESINRLQIFFIFVLITAVIGLKLSSS